MALNCKPGDLARVVGWAPRLGLNDHVVLLAKEQPFLLYDVWHWRLAKPLDFVLGAGGKNRLTGEQFVPGQPVQVLELPDYCLRPIRDPGDDAVDEMVRKVGAAPKTLTEVREALS